MSEAGWRGSIPEAPHRRRPPCGDPLLGQVVRHVGGCQQVEGGGMLLDRLSGEEDVAQGLQSLQYADSFRSEPRQSPVLQNP